MKLPRLLLITAVVCASTDALAHQNLRSGPEMRLEAHAHQVTEHAALYQHYNSPKVAKMEAHAHQNSATVSMNAIHHGKLYEQMQQLIKQRKNQKETTEALTPPTEPKNQESAAAHASEALTESKPHTSDVPEMTTEPKSHENAAVQATEEPTESKPHTSDGVQAPEISTEPKAEANNSQ